MSENIWYCKIGGEVGELPMGADSPMRRAIAQAFHDLTGRWPEFTFSGWGQKLTESERAVVENRIPDYDKVMKEQPAQETSEGQS